MPREINPDGHGKVMPFYAELGGRIQERLRELDLSHSEFADLISKSRQHVSNMIAGRFMINAHEVLSLAKTLKKSPLWLLGVQNKAKES